MATSKIKKKKLPVNAGSFPDRPVSQKRVVDDNEKDDDFLFDIKNEQLILGQVLNSDICKKVFVESCTYEDFLVENHRVIAFCIDKAYQDDTQITDDIFDVYRYDFPGEEKGTGGLSYVSKLRKTYNENLTSKSFGVYIEKLKKDSIKYRINNDCLRKLMQMTRDPSSSLDDISEVGMSMETLLSEAHDFEKKGFKTMADANKDHDDDVKSRTKGLFGPSGFLFLDEFLTEGLAPGKVSVVAGRPGMGKCQSRNTPILMFDGSIKPVQDVQVGDQLMGPDSKPRNVLSLARGRDEMFDLIPNKGDIWGFNRAHIHSFRMSTDMNSEYYKDEIYNYTIDELEDLPSRIRSKLKIWRTGVDFLERELPFDPRWVGLWLGDGSVGATRITNPDTELIPYFEDFSSKHGFRLDRLKPNSSGCPAFSFSTFGSGERHHSGKAKPNPLLDFCRSLIIDGEKRIHNEYLRSSEQQRLELLAGLVDSDGHLTNGCYEIITKYDGLCEDILYLARSLGLAAYKFKKIGTIKETGFESEYYKIIISGHINRVPCLIHRKRAPIRKTNKNALNVGFDYESKGDGDYYGFSIDGDQLYLLGDFTVTHNSAFVGNSMARLANKPQAIPSALFSLEMPTVSMIDRLNSIETDIPLKKLIQRDLTSDEAKREKRAKKKRESKPIYICDDVRKTMSEIKRDLKVLVDKHGVRVCYIDLFMKVKKPGGMQNKSTADQYTEMLNEVQRIARELWVHISLVVQIGRKAEMRNDKRPVISDLKDSGAFEEVADLILLFYREAYYLSKNVEEDFEVDAVEIIIGKQRQGQTGTVKAEFIGETTKMRKLTKENEEIFKKMVAVKKKNSTDNDRPQRRRY